MDPNITKFSHGLVLSGTRNLSIFIGFIATSFSNANIEGLIKVITKLPNSEQSYKGKVKTHNYINRQNQSITI
jgi:hypothetical protein